MSEKVIYINRGIPGSGKSTKAKTLAPKENIFSTDDYWMKDGKYEFNPNLLGVAHNWNITRAEKAMFKKISPIVIDNTNIRRRDFAPYVALAKKHGYKVIETLPDSPWWKDIYPRIVDKTFDDDDVMVFFARNTHNVPFDSIKRMMERWEN